MELRMVMIGNTGSGKSATGNNILRCTKFVSKRSSNSVTTKNEVAKAVDPQGRQITVVDTIGLYDTKTSMTKNVMEIQDSLRLAGESPHAFLVILTPNRHTEQEKDALDIFAIMFGPKLFNYVIVVFTGGDDIPNTEEFLHDANQNESLGKLLRECHGRSIIINNKKGNKMKNEDTLSTLIEMVLQISDNGNTYYQEDISIFQGPLKKYAEKWTRSRWNSDQIRIVIREQGEERERKHQELIKTYEEAKKKAEEERDTEKQKQKRLMKMVSMGYMMSAATGLTTLFSSNSGKSVADCAFGLMGALSSRSTGSEMLSHSLNSFPSTQFDLQRSFSSVGSQLLLRQEVGNTLKFMSDFGKPYK